MIRHIKTILKHWSIYLLLAWILISLLGPLFIHEPHDGLFPAIIPYGPESIHLEFANAISPFNEDNQALGRTRHWLGTDELGRDVLTLLIYGGRTALFVGLGSVLLSALVGISLGILAAFMGDQRLWFRKARFYLSLAYLLITLIYFTAVFPWHLVHWMIQFILIAFLAISYLGLFRWSRSINSYRFSETNFIRLPLDLLVSRAIEIMEALPLLFIIISLSALFRTSILTIILIIGISNWAVIARYSRAEGMRIKNLDYIQAAEALGYKDYQMLLRHILPNALPPVLITLAFGLAAAILIEASLSFLGIGIGTESASWGAMLASARANPDAWWLVTLPGIAIFLLILSCNSLRKYF